MDTIITLIETWADYFYGALIGAGGTMLALIAIEYLTRPGVLL